MKKTVNWTISDFVVRLFLTCECAFFKKKARSVNFQYQCNRKTRPAIRAGQRGTAIGRSKRL